MSFTVERGCEKGSQKASEKGVSRFGPPSGNRRYNRMVSEYCSARVSRVGLSTKLGKDQKGLHKRGIHDQGDFWKFPLETTV